MILRSRRSLRITAPNNRTASIFSRATAGGWSAALATALLLAPAAWGQSSRRNHPEFTPPVHRAPATRSTSHSTRVEFQRLESGSGRVAQQASPTRSDDGQDQSRWQAANPAQRGRVRTARTQNAIYQRPDGADSDSLPGQLTSESEPASPEVQLDDPAADPYGDRLPPLRTQHDQLESVETTLRGDAPRGRAFAASLTQSQDIVDPYQPGAARSGQEQESEPRSLALAADKSCDDFRNELFNKPISDLDVNISAVRAPGAAGGTLPGEPRSWSDVHGQTLGTGSMVDLHHGYVVIRTHGGTQRIPVAQLGDADLAALASAWRLPADCTMGDFAAPVRCWIPQTVTWKASNLCHKPLYFEDEQLERYGHSAGPILQPLKSTAHFFVRFATWPYATGIHPHNECQYALGFYRPGNCAPWLIDPIPISLAGATRQALVMTGGAFILP